MHRVALFVEDFAHETVLRTLIERLAAEYNVALTIEPRSVRGGAGRAVSELRQYIHELVRARASFYDLLVIGRDANCKGLTSCRHELDGAVKGYSGAIVYAIPDPHIERWLLLDSSAFKTVLGRGCNAPDQKCDRDRYKRQLSAAVRAAGLTPLLGGIEHAEALVQAMDLQHVQSVDRALHSLIDDLRAVFKQWEARP